MMFLVVVACFLPFNVGSQELLIDPTLSTVTSLSHSRLLHLTGEFD